MNKSRNIFLAMILMLGLVFAKQAIADTSKTVKHGKSDSGHHEMKYSKGGKKGDHGGHKAGHMGGSYWKRTLTDDQKKKADLMHLEMKKSLSILKAKLKLKKAELNNLVVSDNPDTKAIHQKIDEALELKREIMRTKYGHKVEMRSMLTPDQRVSFDMGLLHKTGHGKGKGHH